MDVYEDPAAPVDARIQDLLRQMTVEEKTSQLATLYGYGRVLADSLPTARWKSEVWKDGIANIDEQLNGIGRGRRSAPELIYPFSNHAEAINRIQRWFVEETPVADKIAGADKHQDFVLDMQRQSLILLKNKDNVLPLDKGKIKKVLVTGPLTINWADRSIPSILEAWFPGPAARLWIFDCVKSFL